MTTVRIPLKKSPSQRVSCVLSGQPCTITLRELGGRQYFSLSLNGNVICENVLIVNRSRIVRKAYTGFIGDFASLDLQGDEPPKYTGWGDRWLLAFSDDE